MMDSMLEAMALGASQGAFLNVADDIAFTGSEVGVAGRQRVNFASTSYLGLELHRRLVSGCADAARRFGTQFPLPNAFVACPLYSELTQLVDQMSGGNAVLAQSTTLAHQAAMGTVIRSGDAVLLAKSSHPSQHVATALLNDVSVTLIEHDPAKLEESLRRLGHRHRRVWYMFDGLSSLRGEFAPFDDLVNLQQKYAFLHLYVDEAHSTSWTGLHGRGEALERIVDRSRLVVVLSLNKAFAAAGSAVICPDRELRDLLRRTGGPILYSGAIQPPMLGAAVASAKIHLSGELEALQNTLMQRIDCMLHAAKKLALPLANWQRTPLFFVRCGSAERAMTVFRALLDQGFCVCPAVPPLAPPDDSGVRITLTIFNKLDDIERLAAAVCQALSE